MKKIFIICSVRMADNFYREKLEWYTNQLEKNGHKVHLPHRDTNQKATGLEICTQNAEAIKQADEVHIFYNGQSQGTHFDMGVAFANRKKIVVVEVGGVTEGKSFNNMLREWEQFNNNKEMKPTDSTFPSDGYRRGIDVRTYISTKIMAGLLSNNTYTPENAAEDAVKYADALIVELNKEQK